RGVAELIEEGVRCNGADVVPAHMRHRLIGSGCPVAERPDSSFDPGEARSDSFVAGCAEHLHADANTEHRHSVLNHTLFEHRPQAGGVEPFHRMIEGADAGKDDSVSVAQLVRRRAATGGNVLGLKDVEERLNVANAVVDDADHRTTRFSMPSAWSTLAPR